MVLRAELRPGYVQVPTLVPARRPLLQQRSALVEAEIAEMAGTEERAAENGDTLIVGEKALLRRDEVPAK